MAIQLPDTAYTRQVKQLISQLSGITTSEGTVMSDAIQFFSLATQNKHQRQKLEEAIGNAENDEAKQAAENYRNEFLKRLEERRIERVQRFDQFARTLLSLSEGQNEDETLNQSAKLLGTLLLLTEGKPQGDANYHQQLKPIYKAVLALRLVDEMLKQGNIKHNYLGKYLDSLSRFKGNKHWTERWYNELAIPIIKAALLQDIGLQHPNAQHILHGKENELDPYRLLDESERQALLKLNFHHSMHYVKEGLGIGLVVAETPEERETCTYIEEQALTFCLETIQDATILKNHIGDVIKIPQIYTSFVLSTKNGYTRKDLPKGYMVIEQLTKNQTLEKRIANPFMKMVGYFPQGFGISYIPLDEKGIERDNYEFAIVNRFFPDKPAEPKCRTVTRNMSFVSAGKDIEVKRPQNLFFTANHKKLVRHDPKRLNELMSQISGGHSDKKAEDITPSFWEPFTFFQEKKHQNLWNLSAKQD